MTRMRYLKANERTRFPSELCFIAVGSTSEQVVKRPRREVHTYCCHVAEYLRLEGAQVTRQHTQIGTDVESFWTYLDGRCSIHRPVWIIGYDLTRILTLLGLWRLLDVGRYSLVRIIDADPPVVVEITSQVGKVICCDVRNWFREPWSDLEVLANGTARPMQCVDVKSSDVLDRCIHDCRIVSDVMLGLVEYIRSHDLGNFKQTIGLQALAAYRHRLGPRRERVRIDKYGKYAGQPRKVTQVFPLPHDNIAVHQLERRANYGGHEEVFFRGAICQEDAFWQAKRMERSERHLPWIPGPVYHVDVNSLYPSVMAEREYPYKLVGYADQSTPEHLGELMANYCVIADVLVKTDLSTYPCRNNGRVIYPVGSYWTTLADKELMHAMGLGQVEKVGFHACYRTMDLFSDYVDYFWRLKQRYKETGNRVYYALTKLLLNSLWGKFSQRRYTTVRDNEWQLKHRWGKEYVWHYGEEEMVEYRAIAGTAWRVERSEVSWHAFPAIGACVTASAREHMREVRKSLPNRSVLYQGVDSLILTQEGMEGLLAQPIKIDDELGSFRLEGQYDTGCIRSTQDYELGDKKVIRGLSHSARQCGVHAYTFDQRVGLGGQLDTIPQEQITYCQVDAKYSGTYRGGIVGQDGWVSPIRLP